MRVLNTQQMREADRLTIDEIGLPSVVLMENAGRRAVAAMEGAFEDLATSKVGVLCGRGNTGGDGFVVARTLTQRGIEAAVFLLGSVGDVRGDARINLEILGRIGLTVVEITTAQEWELHFSEISECDLIVDAIVGTGFHGPVTGLLETVIADVNGLAVPVVRWRRPIGRRPGYDRDPAVLRGAPGRDDAGVHDRRARGDRGWRDRFQRRGSCARPEGGHHRAGPRPGSGSIDGGLRAGDCRAVRRPAGPRRGRVECVQRRSRAADGPRWGGRNHPPASRRDGPAPQ